ncbi:multiubiquitin domain-containing protein [Lentzea sp. BCCO 10_0798]|uniref:Multiubiquitin domain-containing protein n=1 Tax=Lentzea kristufekii TaxID=3095430 RepID=A0ABU4U3D5_9PSEU|nr:multiubiquitin domain-containing protein [Lentzea sp. BCCO 10_0798]MDX8054962.1 multiubiquitin domain-containing protein [Lentzea sp. BCCO 10_0798]
MPITTEHTDREAHERPVRFQVTVNKHAVTLTEHRMTGLEIKQAAKDQGAAVEVDFQLSVKRGHRYEVVGDDDTIAVHKGQEFIAVAPDDNS